MFVRRQQQQQQPDGRERRRFTEEEVLNCSQAATSNSYHFHFQVLILEDWFDKNPYPKRAEREELSQILMVSCQLWKACTEIQFGQKFAK